MAWARIDDGFDDHEKVLALLDMDNGAAAIGLWTLCLTWAHRNTRKKGKTPGLLPSTLPRRFVGREGRAWAALLVEVGLWDEVDDGWMIHDFAEYLPDKEVSAARSAAGKKGAATRWGNRQTDGNLPSPDSKSDGKPMASDGQAGGQTPLKTPTRPKREPSSPEDGSLPSSDSKLPSVSHPSDDKPMANDGSRAGARREWVDVRTTVLYPEPGPEPVPPSAGAVAPRATGPAQASEGLTLTQRSKRITDAYAHAEPMCKWPAVNGIVLKALKSEKWTDGEIQAAVLRLAAANRGMTTETLRRELAPPTGGSRSTTDERVEAAYALARELAQEAQANATNPPEITR